ncbi:hypothetical protein VC88_11545 [Geobacillus sp. A8]|uniref:hypothetical protein n=1 Tax=Geobacillus sp. T6 TaxID=1659191 RepID=UPI0005192807|nr:hypothetical protein [Geobacillus sp. T6]RAN22418.1 hypothetical protein VC88_11545 [Geobacillus sp. A8]
MLPACHRLALERVSAFSRIAFAIAAAGERGKNGGKQPSLFAFAALATANIRSRRSRPTRQRRLQTMHGAGGGVVVSAWLRQAKQPHQHGCESVPKMTATVPSPSGV